ncbi:MAG: hypothetical protein IPP77_03930 [Bacteroidetes bacterium]|nr:hypothetical protein [Bacteroidota bacterium]
MSVVKSEIGRFYRKITVRWLLFVVFVITTSFSFVATYETKANLIAVDSFSNFYAMSDNRLQKFSTDGKFLYRYEEYRFGKFGTLDVTNPLKIMVFYPDFMTVTTLDRFLAPITTYNFFNLGYQNITAIASSTDNRLWFYDNVDFKLKKIDEAGKIFRESQPLNIIIGEAPSPNFIIEKDNRVYVNDPEIGILVFDLFGGYSKTIPLKGLKKFQILKEQVIYFENNSINSYNPTTFESVALALPDTSNIQQAVLEKDCLGILKKDHIDFYKY